MCRLFAITSEDPLSPLVALEALDVMREGHEAVIYDKNETQGGKMVAAIPHSRIPKDVVQSEVDRMRKILPHVHLQQDLKQEEIEQLQADYAFLVIATGAQQPRTLPVPGQERLVTANDFLAQAKRENIKPGKRVVIIAVGDQPELSFLPPDVATEEGFVVVDSNQQTTNTQIFAIGDIVAPDLLTDAIGAGRKAAQAIIDILAGRRPMQSRRQMLDRQRISLEYFDPRIIDFKDMDHCGSQRSSCGTCRDCGLCITICPEAAISKQEMEGSEYEYVVDASKCIGCGFCGAACPCGIWNLVENDPLI